MWFSGTGSFFLIPSLFHDPCEAAQLDERLQLLEEALGCFGIFAAKWRCRERSALVVVLLTRVTSVQKETLYLFTTLAYQSFMKILSTLLLVLSILLDTQLNKHPPKAINHQC